MQPIFFPGGDVGTLAVNGTVNDLAMSGARPRYLSLGFILEEGLAMDDLARVVASVQRAAREADVAVVAGDTKVVERGKGDGIYITSSGLGVVVAPRPVAPYRGAARRRGARQRTGGPARRRGDGGAGRPQVQLADRE